MPFEDEFSHALWQAADDAPPPSVEAMAVGAQRRGERRKRRRTIVAGAAAVVLLAGAGGLVLQLRSSATPTVVSAAPVTATADTGRSAAPTSAGKVVTAAQMLELLRARLPAGLALTAPMSKGSDGPQRGPVQEAMAGFTITDARGKGGVVVSVTRVGVMDPASRGFCPPSASSTPTCTGTAQPDGSYLWVNRAARAVGGEQLWEAILAKADGTLVTVSSSNLPGPGAGAQGPTRDAPVLDTPQLSAIVLDPVWQQVAAALGGSVA